MAFGEESSGFWFYGRLGPTFLVPPFNVSDVEVGDGARLEIGWEGIGLWASPGHRSFKQPGEATSLFRTVVGAWAAMSGTALTVAVEGWVEAHHAEFLDATMGWFSNRPGAAAQALPDTEISRNMRSACELAVRVRSSAAYRLALRDIHSALSDTEDDAFVFAYRALEDIARAVTGSVGQLRDSDWAALHERLGQEAAEARAEIEPLRLARNAVVHGTKDNEALFVAHQRRAELLLDARRRVLRALASDPELGLDSLPAVLPADDPWATPNG